MVKINNKELTREEIIEKIKAKRTNIPGQQDNSFISDQAIELLKRIDNIDLNELVDWWHRSPEVGSIAGGHILRFLEKKSLER